MKVVCYGVGSGCERVIRELNDSVEIVAFADTKRAGEIYSGKVVLCPSDLANLTFDFVLVCSEAFHEIFTDLTNRHRIVPEKVLNALNYVMQNPGRIELCRSSIITGLSYAWGIDEKLIDGCSLAAPSQDLLADLCWTEKYLQLCGSPRIAVVGLAYYSFDYDMFQTSISRPSKVNIGIFNRMSAISDRLDVHAPDEAERLYDGLLTLQDDIEIMRRIFHVRNNRENVEGLVVGSGLSERRKQLAERHARIFPATEQRNIELLEKLLKLHDANGIKPIFVVHPQHEEYRRYYPSENVERFHRIMNMLRPGAQLFDFYGDARFSSEDFADADHLNINGKKKMNEMITNLIRI